MLSHYDLEQQFPAFGFGAKFKSKGDTKSCFPLTRKSSGYCVHGITVNISFFVQASDTQNNLLKFQDWQ